MRCCAKLGELRTFRTAIYRSLGHRRDALVEMIDATSCGGASDSLPHLSLVPLHQRRHGSVYAALKKGTVNAQQLSATLVRHPLAGGQPAFAVGVSAWNRAFVVDGTRGCGTAGAW